jgi:hypothetical protein
VLEAKLLPNFDFTRMTALAMGKNWRAATPEQQKRITDEFRALLVRTYSGALNNYRNETIEYKPLRMNPTDTDVTVRTLVQRASGAPIQMDYSLEKKPDGWKCYDVIVGGVSLVTNYRDEFKRPDQGRRRGRPHQDARRPQQGRGGQMSIEDGPDVAIDAGFAPDDDEGRWTYAGAAHFRKRRARARRRRGRDAARARRRRPSTTSAPSTLPPSRVLVRLRGRASEEGGRCASFMFPPALVALAEVYGVGEDPSARNPNSTPAPRCRPRPACGFHAGVCAVSSPPSIAD